MESALLLVLTSAASYLLGSLNGSLLVARLVLRMDIRDYGSGNAGMTNSVRVMGKRLTLLVVIVDIGKGISAVLLGGWLLGEYGRLVGGALACVGHNFPLFFRFKGGKGILTSAAVMAFVDWRLFLIAIGVFIFFSVPTRYVGLGSIMAAATLPITGTLFHWGNWPMVGFASLISVMAIVMHRENIARLAHGKERKFSLKRGPLEKREGAHDKS